MSSIPEAVARQRRDARVALLRMVAIVVAIGVCVPWIANAYWIKTLTSSLALAVAAAGTALLYGQLGLVSLGLPHTVLRLLVDMPDHGLWARGRDRLYVHRGTGHYGFPLRLGVPAEESLLRVHLA